MFKELDNSVRRLIASRAINFSGDGIAAVSLPFLILQLGGTAADIALSLLTVTATGAVAALASGPLVLRFGSGRAARLAAGLLAVTQLPLAGLGLLASELNLPLILMVQVLFGVSNSILGTALISHTPAIVEASSLRRVNGYISISSAIASAVGPALGGVVVATFGPSWALFLNALSFLAILILLPSSTQIMSHELPSDRADASRKNVFQAVPWLRLALIAQFAWACAAAIFYSVGPVAASRGAGPASWAIAASPMAVGAGLGGFALVKLRPKAALSVSHLALTAVGLQVLAFSLNAPIGVIFVVSVVAGIGLEYANGLWTTILQHLSPRLLPRVASVASASEYAASASGYLLAIAFSSRLPVPLSLGIAVAMMVLPCVAIAAVRGQRKVEVPS